MRLKPKTVRRLLLLAVVAVVVVGAAFSLFVVRRWQNDRILDRHRREGLAALAAGDNLRAVTELNTYIHRGRNRDPEARLAYARARVEVEEPDFSHLRAAVDAYRTYLGLVPGDVEPRRALVKLYILLGDYGAAKDIADKLLPEEIATAGPEYLDMLRDDGVALAAGNFYGPRLDAVVSRILDLAPLDLQGRLLQLEVLYQAGRKTEARDTARRLLADHPTDPVARVIAGASFLLEPTNEDVRIARVKLAQAVGVDPSTGAAAEPFTFPSADFAGHVVDIFDRIGSYDLSIRVLFVWYGQRPKAPMTHEELALARSLARRLWQAGDSDGIRGAFGPPAATTDSEILAFIALSERHLGRSIRQILELLVNRPDDFRAAAWSKVLPISDPTPNPGADAEILKSAIKATSRLEPVFLVLLGDSLAGMARVEEARDLWLEAAKSKIAVGWAYPKVRAAEVLLEDDQVEDAAKAASEALLADHNNPHINALWFEIQAALIERGGSLANDARILLQALELAIAQVERAELTPEMRAIWERLLPPRILFLARADRRDQAISAVRAALASPQPLAERTLQRLASVSASEGLGVESECLARAASVKSPSPSTTLAQAIDLSRHGKAEEGLKLLRRAATANSESSLAIARFMDHIAHPDSLETWIALGDQFHDDPAVQRACLTTPTTAADTTFIDRTIDRYKALPGSDSTVEDALVRTAKARNLLYGTPTAQNVNLAIDYLNSAIKARPSWVDPKLVLASAFTISDPVRGIGPDLPRATAQLNVAANLEPRNGLIAIELARLLQRQGDFTLARDILARAALDPVVDPSIRLAAAQLLVSQGDLLPHSLQALTDLDTKLGADSSPALLTTLAAVYESLRREDQADVVYSRLSQHPRADAEALFAVARFAQGRNQSDRVTAAVARLDASRPGIKPDVLARLAELRADHAAARTYFETAVNADPHNPAFWRHYIAFLLAQSAFADAAKAAERGAAANPGDSSLHILLERARLLAASGTPDLKPLIEALAHNPASAELAEALKAVDAARERGDLDHPDRITALADRFPTLAPLQVFLAQKLAPFSPERAVGLASRARTVAPADAVTARAVTALLQALGRWGEMLVAASAWRIADVSRSPDPDLAIALARLNLKDFAAGIADLAPWPDRAAANPKMPGGLLVLDTYARLLIGAGRQDDAHQFLAQILPRSPECRAAVWLRIAAERLSLPDARAWIDEARPLIPPDSIDEHLAIADALLTLAARFPAENKALLSECERGLIDLVGRTSPSTASAWEALGTVRQRLADFPGAQEAFQRAINQDGSRSASLAALATIFLEVRRDPAGALPLAERAVLASPDGKYLGLLAVIHIALADQARAAGDSPAAATSYRHAADAYRRAAALTPADPQAWSQLAQASTSAGDYAGAAAAWERFLVIPGLPSLPLAAAKNNLAMAILQQEPPREQLDRARQLVNEALAISDEPAYHDSLGWIELQAGKRDQAIEAFRRVIGSDPPAKSPHHSAVVGLATALASGNPEQRREAAVLARAIDPKDFDSSLAAKFRRLHSMVDSEKP